MACRSAIPPPPRPERRAPLGGAGGSGGEHDQLAAPRRFGRSTSGVGVDQLVCRQAGDLTVGPTHHPRAARFGRHGQIHCGGELFVVEDQVDAFTSDDFGQRRPGEAGVEQQHVGADSVGGGQRFDETAMVAAHQCDGPGRPAGQPLQAGGQRVTAPVEFGVGARTVLVDDRRAIAAPLRRHGDPGGGGAAFSGRRYGYPEVFVRAHGGQQSGPAEGHQHRADPI